MIVIHMIAPGPTSPRCENREGRVACGGPAVLLAVHDGSDVALCPECFCELAHREAGVGAVPFVLTPDPA